MVKNEGGREYGTNRTVRTSLIIADVFWVNLKGPGSLKLQIPGFQRLGSKEGSMCLLSCTHLPLPDDVSLHDLIMVFLVLSCIFCQFMISQL